MSSKEPERFTETLIRHSFGLTGRQWVTKILLTEGGHKRARVMITADYCHIQQPYLRPTCTHLLRYYIYKMTKEIFLVKLGARIRKLRKEKNLSLDKLAALCDYEKANLSRIESGKTNTTIVTLFTISKVMEVPLCEFFKD